MKAMSEKSSQQIERLTTCLNREMFLADLEEIETLEELEELKERYRELCNKHRA